jgi:hypothetical protein
MKVISAGARSQEILTKMATGARQVAESNSRENIIPFVNKR